MTAIEQTTVYADRHPFMKKIAQWARWSNSAGAPGRCASIESRYLPERLTEAEGEDRTRKNLDEKPDLADIERVEQSVCALQSDTNRRLLIARFVDRLPDRRICRQFEIPYRELEFRLFSVISDVELEYQHVCEVYANNPGLKIQRHKINGVLPYGRPTR